MPVYEAAFILTLVLVIWGENSGITLLRMVLFLSWTSLVIKSFSECQYIMMLALYWIASLFAVSSREVAAEKTICSSVSSAVV